MQTLKKALGGCCLPTPHAVTNITAFGDDSTDSSTGTPTSNTGLDSQNGFSVAIDWLDVTFRNVPTLAEVEAILKEAEVMLDDEIEFCPNRATYNSRQWTGSGRGLKGTLVLYDDGIRPELSDCIPPALKIIASGSVIGVVDQYAVALWLNGRAVTNQLDCTRIDIAMDDHEKFIKLEKITEAHNEGNFFNASISSYIESKKRGHDKGITLYFGSPKSDKRLRMYDKTVESLGKILGNRWEAEFRRKAARTAMYQWIEARLKSEGCFIRWCQNTVTGVIDFRDRSGDDPNRDRCPVLPWFQSLIDRLRCAPSRIRVALPVIGMQKSIEWVKASVAPSLAAVRAVLGDDFPKFINEAINEGGQRLSIVRRKLILSTFKESLEY